MVDILSKCFYITGIIELRLGQALRRVRSSRFEGSGKNILKVVIIKKG